MGALDGILVVAIEQAVAAPLCTQRLRDAGARVIKIERAEGDFARSYDHIVDGDSAYFLWLNRGKESIVLDFRQPADAALLQAMLARADIFVQNLAPGAAERAGFGSAQMRERHPKLITCDIMGYDGNSPWRDKKAYDLLIQCEAGLAATTGTAESMVRTGVSVADIAAGLNAASAIMEALFERTRTGKGRGISVALFDALAEWMTVPLLHFEHGGKAPRRTGLHHPSIAPYGAFACSDGHQIVVAVQNEREWSRFCATVMEQPELADDARFTTNAKRVENRAALEDKVGAVLSGIAREEAVKRLEAAGIGWADVNEIAGLSRHPALRRTPASGSAGPVSLPSSPVIRDEGRHALAMPALDSHGQNIRKEFA
ncbi:CaiB/BaiF CoA transferase family protein [Sphingobium phenoxybenzoativorans]|nr:CaiB/BaiF CoA-transferase family protein [Sphingobium phenoxybenzoativorans]